jgi:hypothetical protein
LNRHQESQHQTQPLGEHLIVANDHGGERHAYAIQPTLLRLLLYALVFLVRPPLELDLVEFVLLEYAPRPLSGQKFYHQLRRQLRRLLVLLLF